MSRKRREIKSIIYEDERYCSGCGKCLANTSGMIHIIVPGSIHLEYCSWRCLYVHIKNLLSLRVLARRQAARDLLKELGYKYRGIDPKELENPVDNGEKT